MNAWRRRLGAGALLPIFPVAGCSYLGKARDFDPATLDREPGWLALRSDPPVHQEAEEDCGVAAIAMVLAY